MPNAVPTACGIVSTDVDRLVRGCRELLADPAAATALGLRAREHALRRFGLDRFLTDWDDVLAAAVA